MDRTTATEHIITSIAGPSGETDPADFDIDAIADAAYDAAGGTWDITALDPSTFWAIVEEYAR